MAKTSLKDALKNWAEENPDTPLAQAKDIGLQFKMIDKMDNSLVLIPNVEKLSLSTNLIEKISGLMSLKKLRILALGRNMIKTFTGLEPLGDCLEELWISYNFIEKTKGIGSLKKLKVLYMCHNSVKEWGELNKINDCPVLEDLVFCGNPIVENLEESAYRVEIKKRLPRLKKLDGEVLPE
ncbi:hypothetical protein M8J75_004890 [Diaphorina citri]|nr:hypothetical protein M8J75_004890 [Diaphorina citri]KAI5752918.1 hypothetical protein M8J77_021784 [Diaphorina citri]